MDNEGKTILRKIRRINELKERIAILREELEYVYNQAQRMNIIDELVEIARELRILER